MIRLIKKIIKWILINPIEKEMDKIFLPIRKQIDQAAEKEIVDYKNMLDKKLAEMKAEKLSLSLEIKMIQTKIMLLQMVGINADSND